MQVPVKMNLTEFSSQTLLLDLETTRTGQIRHIGAVFNGQVFERTQRAGSRAVLEELERFARPAAYVLGHNLLGHDYPILKVASPWLDLLDKPVVDTLYLSPLAFPENPYHRLVKDYKLVREAINSPVQDARLAFSVFADQWHSFLSLTQECPDLLGFYRFCSQDSTFNGFSGQGLARVFDQFVGAGLSPKGDMIECFIAQAPENMCRNKAREVVPSLLADAARRPTAAYCLAWMRVAGGNSVLPP